MTHSRRPGLRPLFAPICLCLGAAPAFAVDLAWPGGAQPVVVVQPTPGQTTIATAPFDGATVPTLTAEGAVSEQIWQIPGSLGDPTLMLGLIRDQLDASGFDILFTCADQACGGFDFRFALPIAEGPAMHVDLGNFQYLSAMQPGPEGPTHLAVILSQGGQQGYAHLTLVTPPGAQPTAVTSSTRLPSADLPPPDLIGTLLEDGRAVLDDLAFDTGAASLSGAEYDSLIALGTFLLENPAQNIVLVGHTDTEGSLDANITLSRTRANAVRSFLIDRFDVPANQIRAEGIGFLAPRAANATEDGREANRRVEVVLADTQ